MNPELVSFTNYDVSPRTILATRLSSGPFPPSWERVEFDYSSHYERPLILWLAQNIRGRFGYILISQKAIVYFEDVADLMLFRILDGENEIKNNNQHRV